MLKKTIAVALAVIICLCAFGCSKDPTPDGMKSVTVEGEPFILYVPTDWTDNSVSGISGAFYLGESKVMVSARYYTPENAEQTLEDCVNALSESYSSTLRLYTVVSRSPSVLGGKDAIELIYTSEPDSQKYTTRQMICKHGEDIVILSFNCPSSLYEQGAEQFTEIANVFVLCDKAEVKNDCVTDKKTPEGMKIASSDKVEYRFYAPTSWVCYSESGQSEAYYPVSGKPNVSVTSYSPENPLSASEYFASCEVQYREKLSGYELLSSEEREVGGRSAVSYTYKAVYGDTSFKIMQTVLVYREMVYSITYTALADAFDTYTADVISMLDAFTFR